MNKRILSLLIGVITVINAWSLEIAVSDNPSKFEKLASEELQYFLQEITGDKVNIVSESKAKNDNVIFLGQTEFAKKNSVDGLKLGNEEWVLKSIKNNLIISGGRPVGTLYGVYELLERNGVSFLAMDCTVVPKKSKLNLNFNIQGHPPFAERGFGDQIPKWLWRTDTPMKYRDDYWRWQLRNRANNSQGRGGQKSCYGEYLGEQSNVSREVSNAHNFHTFVSPKKYFKTHPEYFSMDENGERFFAPGKGRRHGQLCLTNADVLKITLEHLRKIIKKDRSTRPKEEWPVIYDISQMDSSKFFCKCPKCQAIVDKEGEMGLLLGSYINPIAKTIAKEYPEIKIRTFAYSFAKDIPKSIKPEKNVVIWYCDLYMNSDCYRPMISKFNTSQYELFKKWSNISENLYLWDYGNMGGIYFNPPRIEVSIDAIINDIRLFSKTNLSGIMVQYDIEWLTPQMFSILELYVGMQMMNNPNLDAEKLISTFIDGYYGNAAKEMKEVFSIIREGVATHIDVQKSLKVARWHYLTPEFYVKLYTLLKKAESKVTGVEKLRVQTEMIVPLWDIIRMAHETKLPLEKAGYNLLTIKKECEKYTLANLYKYHPQKPYGTKFRPININRLEALVMNLQVPKKFEKYRDSAFVFGTPHAYDGRNSNDARIVDDKTSSYGKTVRYAPTNSSLFSPKTLTFIIRNSEKDTFRNTIKNVPQDEKYHWYNIPKVKVGGHTWMFGMNNRLNINLSQAYRVPAGIENDNFNVFDVWYSVKFEGNAYVKNSKKDNAISINYVVLIPHK